MTTRYSAAVSRINPLHPLQTHAFKQFFYKRYDRKGKPLDLVEYQRGQVNGMFFRVNALLLALHRHQAPLLLWVNRNATPLQRSLIMYSVILANTNRMLLSAGRHWSPGFLSSQQEIYQKPVEELWAGLPQRAELSTMRTLWFQTFIRLVFLVYRTRHSGAQPRDFAIPITAAHVQRFMKVFKRYHNYYRRPGQSPGAVFYVGLPDEPVPNGHIMRDIYRARIPVITVEKECSSYPLPGNRDNIYIYFFYLYYFDKLLRHYQSQEYHPMPRRFSNPLGLRPF
eukprot:TRINITY_DN4396_c0_g1_i1.p1 TRINITY_DN4396_c0_g1~~TRINITY_DN4396_c0_g1_i1.p1  ORF type:complete len:311 (+),score=70.73 TRINITY_DN4396_c0_g1_i1:89-934(+)